MQTPDLGSAARLAAITRDVEAWFRFNSRPLPWRERYEPYLVWLSEVMLQQTRMEVVLPYFDRFVRRFPDIAALAAASDDEVTAAWSGLGYYRRARMLRDGAIAIVERFGGTVPESVEELLTIPGIGRYTAGAISSIASGRRAPIVDGNVARILARLDAIDEPLASPALMKRAWSIASELVEACDSPRNFNQGLMELGALVCRPRNPDCPECPIRTECVAWASGAADDFPRPRVRKPSTALQIPLYIVTDRRGRVLLRRESGPLMNAMYQLPHGSGALFGSAPRFEPGNVRLLGTFRHTVTTRRIEFIVYESNPPAAVRDAAGDYTWIDPGRIGEIPHPSYVKKALRLAGR